MKTLLSVLGPTASGKTSLSLAIAQRWGAPIVSADSVQIYRGLDIGSGKVTPTEQGAIPHHLIDICDPCEEFSAGEFERTVDALLSNLFQEHDLVLLVGGAGFYLSAVWEGFDEMPPVPEAVRQQLNAELEREGLLKLIQELREVDPVTFGQIDRQNPRRVVRALEIFRATGTPISTFRQQKTAKQKAYRDLRLGIEWPREQLYKRINQRVLQMVEAGLEAETKTLLEQWGAECKGLQSVGYREWMDYFQGKYDQEEVIRLIQRNSRHYAKRQLTWFRRYPDIHWVPGGDHAPALAWLAGQMEGSPS